jgi:tyrosine-protein kinase Fer
MLCEASEFERDLRTILLPGLLEYQQAIQEDMIDKWKLILRDAIDCCNRCSSSFQVGMVKICGTVAGIKCDPSISRVFLEIGFARSC